MNLSDSVFRYVQLQCSLNRRADDVWVVSHRVV
jgi:hypothetical protein